MLTGVCSTPVIPNLFWPMTPFSGLNSCDPMSPTSWVFVHPLPRIVFTRSTSVSNINVPVDLWYAHLTTLKSLVSLFIYTGPLQDLCNATIYFPQKIAPSNLHRLTQVSNRPPPRYAYQPTLHGALNPCGPCGGLSTHSALRGIHGWAGRPMASGSAKQQPYEPFTLCNTWYQLLKWSIKTNPM